MEKIVLVREGEKKFSLPLLIGRFARQSIEELVWLGGLLRFRPQFIQKHATLAGGENGTSTRIIQIARVDRKTLPASPSHALPLDPPLERSLGPRVGFHYGAQSLARWRWTISTDVCAPRGAEQGPIQPGSQQGI